MKTFSVAFSALSCIASTACVMFSDDHDGSNSGAYNMTGRCVSVTQKARTVSSFCDQASAAGRRESFRPERFSHSQILQAPHCGGAAFPLPDKPYQVYQAKIPRVEFTLLAHLARLIVGDHDLRAAPKIIRLRCTCAVQPSFLWCHFRPSTSMRRHVIHILPSQR